MAIKTPSINKIIRMNEFDLLRTSIVPGNMYMCLDTQKLYFDETENKRVPYFYTGVNTINDLLYNITPVQGTNYYCWEDNSLWLWMNKWISLYSTTTYPSAYVYDDSKNINEVYRYDQPNLPADDNGLLKDGSVIVRDRNRIIKGKLFIDEGKDNLVISSFLGGGIRLLPNGSMSSDGELLIGDEGKSTLRSQLNILNNELFIDYSEKPEEDLNDFSKPNHLYKVYHEGNLDVSAIKVLEPIDIYNKLLDPSLNNLKPFEFNVNMLQGKQAKDFATATHMHIASNIKDFNEKARAQAKIEVRDIFNHMNGEGIDIRYNPGTSSFDMSANNFDINFIGGATGIASINHLQSSTVNLVIDPKKHKHQDYIDALEDLQNQVDNIETIDPNNYYDKTTIENKLALIAATPSPEANKPLLVNSELKLPAISIASDKLSKVKSIQYTGDITGITTTNFEENNIEIALNADNIVSNIPEQGKAVKIDSNGNLPANSISASKLDHNLNLTLTGQAVGQVNIDTSKNTFEINTTLNPGSDILQTKDLGITVASLDDNGKIFASQLPAFASGLIPEGFWNPSSGAPSTNPKEGHFWISNSSGILFEGAEYELNDWCLWYNSQWNHISTQDNVISVNNKKGKVNLTIDDLEGISSSYINYTLGQTIPLNKIVRTSLDGVIEGASVSKLTSEFELKTDDSSDIKVDPLSKQKSTDGSKDLNLKFNISELGYSNIIKNAGHTILNNGVAFPHKSKINFLEGFKVTPTQDGLEIELSSSNDLIAFINIDNTLNIEDTLTQLYKNRKNIPIIAFKEKDNNVYYYLIDSRYPDIVDTTTVNIEPDHYRIGIKNLTNGRINIVENIERLHLSFIKAESEIIIDSITLESSQNILTELLSTKGTAETPAYLPVFDSQPATKKYVDSKIKSFRKYTQDIGDNNLKEFTIQHNLNSDDIIIVIRNNENNQQIYANNCIIDSNTIKINLDMVIPSNLLNVTIYAL